MTAQTIRETYNIETTASDTDLVDEICRRVARAVRGEDNVAGLSHVGPFWFLRTDDVDTAAMQSARALICEHYGLSSDAADDQLLHHIDLVGLEVICYLRDIRGVESLLVDTGSVSGYGVRCVRGLFRSAMRASLNTKHVVVLIDEP